MFTIEDVKKYFEDNREDVLQSLFDFDELPLLIKKQAIADPDHFITKIWVSGSWLSHVLRENGASDEEKEFICFAHGQRCFGGDPSEMAVKMANEFLETGTTKDKPGMKLAKEIYREVIDPQGG